jgi:hypothetical protein
LIGWSESRSLAWAHTRRAFLNLGIQEYQLPTDSLLIQPNEISASAGGSLHFQFDAGVFFAGGAYETFVGGTGSGAPGGFATFPFQPLQGLTERFRVAVNQGSLPGFAGTLDAQGRASALLSLQAGTGFRAGIVGQRLHFAYLAFSANATPFVSEAAVVSLLP